MLPIVPIAAAGAVGMLILLEALGIPVIDQLIDRLNEIGIEWWLPW